MFNLSGVLQASCGTIMSLAGVGVIEVGFNNKDAMFIIAGCCAVALGLIWMCNGVIAQDGSEYNNEG